MFRHFVLGFLILLVILSMSRSIWSAPPDKLDEVLARAETLYYEAEFSKSIALLLPVDESLRSQTEQRSEKISVKLQLALAYIGLNNAERATSFLREIYELDADYRLDAQRFSPKVVSLADSARVFQNDERCKAVRETASKELAARNVKEVLGLLGSMKSKCASLAEVERPTADLLYKGGLESYKKGSFDEALQAFRTVVKLAPQHELATQYIELTESKLQVTADRLFLSWNKNFEAREFQPAAADYRQLMSFKDVSSGEKLNQARVEYRKALTALVETSKRACANGDAAAVSAIQNQVAELLPDASVGEDILAQMPPCTKKDCLRMGSQLVLARLKTRVQPEIPAELQNFFRHSPLTVRVQTRIDEKGDVTFESAQGGNPVLNQAIESALERWKFAPIFDADGPRCVETEIPFVFTP